MEVISIRNLWAGYDYENILQDINLSVNERDFLGIIGPNGGGKTTLLKVLLGLVKAERGEVKVLGEPVEKGRQHIGYVPQFVESDRCFPITAQEVVKMGRLSGKHLFKPYDRNDDRIVTRSLDSVDMLAFKNRPIGQLSGGQRQRVYIARALAVNPKILVLDEPTASVDSEVKNSILGLLTRLNQSLTIVMISHDVSAISVHAKKIVHLNRRLFHGVEKPGDIRSTHEGHLLETSH